MGVYGVALAGWSSNNKYSLLGGLRASAQMVSYEISLGLSLVGVLILSGTFSLREIVQAQQGTFLRIHSEVEPVYGGQFVAFLIYLMSAYAETNRIPFDLPEAETELCAGYHTEYSAMKFAMFFMAEYAQHDHGRVPRNAAVFGRMERPDLRTAGFASLLPVFCFLAKVFGFLFYVHMGARHISALPL